MAERRSVSPAKITAQVIISAILVLIQLAFYVLSIIGIFFIPYINVIMTVVAVILVCFIYSSNSNSSYRLTWTIVVLLFIPIGPILYLFFGHGQNLPKGRRKKVVAYLSENKDTNNALEELKEYDKRMYRMAKLLYSNTGIAVYKNQGSTFYNDGALMAEKMLDEIQKAKRFIFLEYFIVASGEFYDKLSDLLLKKADEGIEVKFLYDAVGTSPVLKKKDMNKLLNHKNIELVVFNPFGTNLNFGVNYRDHRKVLIVDGNIAFVGGINIADEYIHKKDRFGFWRDNGMSITGDAVYGYLLIFAEIWYMSTKHMIDVKNYRGNNVFIEQKGFIMPFCDGPTNRNNPGYNLIMSMIDNAKDSVIISTPYFIIDKEFINCIINKIQSGVDVKILIPKIPDKKSVYSFTCSHIKDIVLAGGHVYTYTPGFNHAKTIVIDNKNAFVSTFNIDYRSMFLHFECGNFLIDCDTVKDIVSDLNNALIESHEISCEEYMKNYKFKRIFAFIFRIIGPLL